MERLSRKLGLNVTYMYWGKKKKKPHGSPTGHTDCKSAIKRCILPASSGLTAQPVIPERQKPEGYYIIGDHRRL